MNHRSLQLLAVGILFTLVSLAAGQSAPKESAGAAGVPEASGDEPQARPGHHEVIDDAYVPPPANRATSPGGRVTRGGYTSVQVNVDANGNNILGDAANEPSIAIDPNNPARMVIGWRQFDTIESNFRQAGNAYSHNGGTTWTSPGVIEPGVFRSDPVLDANADGDFFYNSLTTEAGDYWCHVFKSTDGGMTWDGGTFAQGGDKQWQVIDTTNGIGRNNIYSYWTRFYSICSPDHFTRSTDAGQSFEACTAIPGSPRWGTMAVGPDGELYVVGDGFVLAKSTTMQDPNQPHQWDFTRTVDLGGSMGAFGGPNPGGLLGQVWVAVDHSDGPSRGHVYLLCSVSPDGSIDPMDVMFVRSTDGGQTWSQPVRVNDDPENNGAWQWFGTMSVGPDGRIDVVWLDTRDDPGGYDSELHYSYSEDGGLTWMPNQALSPSFDPHVGWPDQNKMGDYFDMISNETGTNLAYAATFNGEQDVYFMRINQGLRLSFPDGVPSFVAPGQPVTITVRVSPGTEELIPGSPTFHYRAQPGPFQSMPLWPLGGDLYQATLPPMTCSDTPEFYFSAEGSESGVVTEPPGAPANTFTPTVGEFISIISYDFEDALGWTVQNSPGLTDGAWDRGIPVDCDRGDPPTDFDGSGQCYLTDNSAAFGCNSDVDGGYTWLMSPTFSLVEGDGEVHYALWYTNDYGGGGGDELFIVYVSGNNGLSWVPADSLGPLTTPGWIERSFLAGDFVELTDQVRVRFEASDVNGAASVVEAGVDAFSVSRFGCVDSCVWDLDGNGQVTPIDSGLVMSRFGCTVGGGDPLCDASDIDGNGVVNPVDSGLVMSNFGPCP